MRKWMLLLSLLAIASLAILPATAQDTASIRVGHFSPDAPAVDVYVDGEVAIEDLQFTEVSEFAELPAGTYSIAVAPTGSSLDDAVIGPMDWAVEAGTFTTVAAVGSVENETLTATVFTEDFGATASGQARITFLHTIEGESGLDLYGSGVQLIQNTRYPDAAEGRDGAFSREVPAGLYDFDASVAEDRDAVVREVDNVQIQEGENYLIVAVGPQSNEGLLQVVGRDGFEVAEEGTDDGEEAVETEEPEEVETEEASDPVELEGEAMLRVGHFSPDAPAVDIYVDGEVVAEGYEFPEVTAFMAVSAGSHTIALAPAGGSVDDAVLSVDTVIEPDTNVTVAAIGDLEDISSTVFTEDYDAIPEGQARITLLHTIEGESGVDLYGSGIQLIQNLQYPGGDRDGAFTRDVPAGRYNFDVTVAENASAVIREANGVEISAGDTLLLVALGPQSNEGVLLVVTPDGYQNPEE